MRSRTSSLRQAISDPVGRVAMKEHLGVSLRRTARNRRSGDLVVSNPDDYQGVRPASRSF
jgi:hypothetical protein